MTMVDTPVHSEPEASPRTADLRIRGLRLHRAIPGAEAVIVRDLDLDLPAGGSLAIVGESGSGKTLTAKSIMGLLPPTVAATGSIRLGADELVGASESMMRGLRGRRVSLVMQDPFTALHPLRTVGATIAESLDSRHRTKHARDAEIARRLAEVGIAADVAGKRTFELSGGMRQRVGIAAALAKDPDLLIADEPTTALDASIQREVLELLRSIQRSRGMSLVLITHDLDVAFGTCDSVMVLYAGGVMETADAAVLRAGALHPYTRGLLAAAPPLTHRIERFRPIPGNVPPVGTVDHRCPFADRCALAIAACTTAAPPLVEVAEGHRAACIRIGESEPVTEVDAAPPHTVAATASALGAEPDAESRPEPIAVVRDLRKSFGSRAADAAPAVGGVSFEIGVGEAVGLVGESGSGKSTIARCLMGLETPDSGELRVGGLDVSRYSRLTREERRRAYRTAQMVFQDPYSSLNPKRTIGAALAEALAVAGEPGVEAVSLLESVGLSRAHAGRMPHALSGGERQRVAIARALALRPRLLICDEPVAALDVSVQSQVLEVLRSVQESTGMSLLFITHDLAVVRQMTTRMVVLYRGDVVEEGRTAELLDRPRHEYTRRLRAAARI